MVHTAKRLLVALGLLLVASGASAFSLWGPAQSWATARLGYDIGNDPQFGPMLTGEEYRFNVPELTYSFTPAFLNYFGPRGAAEIDKVFVTLNSVPSASSIDLSKFPLTSVRVNHRALALGLLDIKSYVLGAMVQQMGLGDPTRFVYTLRSRWTTTQPDTTNYYIIRRNFDPVSWQISSYINGVLWTYPSVSDVNGGAQSYVFTEPVDPLTHLGYQTAPVASYFNYLVPGGFYTKLTRDDAGGLRYIYRKDNRNIESLTPSAVGLGGGGGPWGDPGGGTNTTGTNVVSTNIVVTTAIREGIEKVRFTRVDFDSLLGFFTPSTNAWTDTYITNSTRVTQNLERPLLAPDILFDVADLQGGDGEDDIFTSEFATLAWVSGVTGTNGTTGILAGPGTIPAGSGATPTLQITFNNITQILWNTWPIDNQDELTATVVNFYGSFDGTTNAPYVYPAGTDVMEIESLVMQRNRAMVWSQP